MLVKKPDVRRVISSFLNDIGGLNNHIPTAELMPTAVSILSTRKMISFILKCIKIVFLIIDVT